MFQRFTQKNKGVAESSRLESKVKLDLKLNRDLDLSIFRQRKKGERFKNLLSLSLQIKGNLLLPDLLFVANPKENRVALKEAHQNNIPTIAFVDSDVDCSLITFPIPINDDNLESIIFCYNLLLKTINSRANVQLQ
jgi:ribosomal protein S2